MCVFVSQKKKKKNYLGNQHLEFVRLKFLQQLKSKRLDFCVLAKLRWTKNPCGTQVSKTRVPVDHLLLSFFFSFFFLSPYAVLRQFFLLLLLPQTSKPISQNPKPKYHDLEIRAKTQTQKSRSWHQSTMGLTISALEQLGFVDLGTKGSFSVFSILVCLLIHFLCFLGWSISVFWVDVLGFFSFLVGLFAFSRLLFCAILGFYFLRWSVLSFLGCCIL